MCVCFMTGRARFIASYRLLDRRLIAYDPIFLNPRTAVAHLFGG
jgi:hypothetical protein